MGEPCFPASPLVECRSTGGRESRSFTQSGLEPMVATGSNCVCAAQRACLRAAQVLLREKGNPRTAPLVQQC